MRMKGSLPSINPIGTLFQNIAYRLFWTTNLLEKATNRTLQCSDHFRHIHCSFSYSGESNENERNGALIRHSFGLIFAFIHSFFLLSCKEKAKQYCICQGKYLSIHSFFHIFISFIMKNAVRLKQSPVLCSFQESKFNIIYI